MPIHTVATRSEHFDVFMSRCRVSAHSLLTNVFASSVDMAHHYRGKQHREAPQKTITRWKNGLALLSALDTRHSHGSGGSGSDGGGSSGSLNEFCDCGAQTHIDRMREREKSERWIHCARRHTSDIMISNGSWHYMFVASMRRCSGIDRRVVTAAAATTAVALY